MVLPVVAQLALPLEVLLGLHLVCCHLQTGPCMSNSVVRWGGQGGGVREKQKGCNDMSKL